MTYHPPFVYCPRKAEKTRDGNCHKFCTDHELGFFFQFCEYCRYGNNRKPNPKFKYNPWRCEK